MGGLGLEKPSVEPRATEHIPEMIQLISALVEKGFAYQGGGMFSSLYRNLKIMGNSPKGTWRICKRVPGGY